jgi:ABC-type multidrug transport system permease subunit
MTTTGIAAPPPAAGSTALASDESMAELITGAPVPQPTLVKTFFSMLIRDWRVLRRKALLTFLRAVMQPLLFVFVFTYVIPKIGGGFHLSASRFGLTFGTILVPGLMAGMILAQGILSVTFPLVMEFSWQRTIEDRALAPVPIQLVALEKVIFGATQALLGGLIVVPIVLVVHAANQTPKVQVSNWPLLIVIMLAASLLAASLGLLLGTIMDPRQMQMMFSVALLPATMLGCVYYPWSALHRIPWLQDTVLINPMVYMSEGLRSMLTPTVPHLPLWAILTTLIGGAAVFGYLGTRTFTRRVIN